MSTLLRVVFDSSVFEHENVKIKRTISPTHTHQFKSYTPALVIHASAIHTYKSLTQPKSYTQALITNNIHQHQVTPAPSHTHQPSPYTAAPSLFIAIKPGPGRNFLNAALRPQKGTEGDSDLFQWSALYVLSTRSKSRSPRLTHIND